MRASEKLERVVGLVGILKPQHGRCAELCRLCVGTTEKRQGIATALMTEVHFCYFCFDILTFNMFRLLQFVKLKGGNVWSSQCTRNFLRQGIVQRTNDIMISIQFWSAGSCTTNLGSL